jgi:hypothetical protein
VQRILRFITSIRLGIALIAWIAIAGALSTLVPQGLQPEEYASDYGRFLGGFLALSGFSRFWSSLAFLLPAFLFFVNLSACALSRYSREMRKKSGRRHGPDILHLGLMLLVLAALLSFVGRQEGYVELSEGESVQLPDGSALRLGDFTFQSYIDGRPRDWISTVDVERAGKKSVAAFPLRVNHPLRLGRLSLYQVSHGASRGLILKDGKGNMISLGRGQKVRSGESSLSYLADDLEGGGVILQLETADKEAEVLLAFPGDKAGPWNLVELGVTEKSGLKAVIDPGYPLLLLSLALILLGLALVFIPKLKEIEPV